MVPRLGGCAVLETMREFSAIVPWRTVQHSLTLVGSHDTTRVRSLVGADDRVVDVAAGLLMTMPGIPMVTYGDEIGMLGSFGEDGRRPMPWDEKQWDTRLLRVYRGLIAARRSSVALRHGGLRWVHADDDALVFLRQSPEETALVHCARAAHATLTIPARRLTGVGKARSVYGAGLAQQAGTVSLVADHPQVNVWVWPTL
jgi:alpha-glucosidase